MGRLGQYELLEEIARGGMGVVYRARGPLGEVAIKRVNATGADPRLIQEARSAHALRHPGIVATHHIDTDPQGAPYLVMELVDGESLGQRLKREGPLPIDEALRLTREICEALAHAHARGVIHRDLKPGNVMVDRAGHAKLADFGLGKVLADSRALTETGAVMGTPGYMPPEQAEGARERYGPRSDVYGVGALLFGLLTGQPPFRGSSVVNTLYAVLQQPAPRLRTLRPDAPAALERLLEACLAKDPAQRPADAQALLEALGDSSPSQPAAPAAVTSAWFRALLAWSLLALLGLGSAALLVLTASAEADPTPTSPPSSQSVPSPSPPSLPAPEQVADPLAAGREVVESNTARALALFDEAIRREDSPDARYQRALAHRRLGDLDQAAADLEAALEAAPDAPAYLRMLATVLQEQGDFLDSALAHADRAVEVEPSLASYHTRSLVHHARQAYAKELADLNWIVNELTDPSRKQAYLLRAAYLELQFRRLPESALRLYDSAEALGPLRWFGYVSRARAAHEVADAYARQGVSKPVLYGRALQDLKRAEELELGDAEDISPLHRGRRILRLGQIQYSLGMLQEALETYDQAQLLIERGVAESRRDGPELAEQLDHVSLYYRALVLIRLNDRERLRSDVARLLTLDHLPRDHPYLRDAQRWQGQLERGEPLR